MSVIHKAEYVSGRNYEYLCGERSGYGDDEWTNVTCPKCLKHKPKKDSLDENLDIFETIPTQLHVRKKGTKAFVRITKEDRGVLIEFFDGETFVDGVVPITAEEWPHLRKAIDQLIGGGDV